MANVKKKAKMGRPAAAPGTKKDKWISFRVTQDMFDAFNAECKRRGLSRADVLSDFIFDITNRCS